MSLAALEVNLARSIAQQALQSGSHSYLCRYLSGNRTSQSRRQVVPLVVFLPWLGASQGAISKFVNLYQNCGCDVMVNQSSLIDFLWPRTGLKNSALFLQKVIKKVETNEQPIVIHSTSIGSYFYALMLLQMKRNPKTFEIVSKNIRAQVIDSPVLGTLKEMAIGVSSVSTSNKLAALGYSGITLGYFALTKPFTVQLYEESIDVIKYHAPKVPSLILSSTSDKMALPEALHGFIKAWEDAGIPTTSKIWSDSEHALHLKLHPELYKQLVHKLLLDALGNKICLPSRL